MIPWRKNVNPVSMPCVTYAMKNLRKNPQKMKFQTVPVKWTGTPVNRIVKIVIGEKSPVVPVVKLS